MAHICACVHKALGNVLFRFDPPLTRAEYNAWKRAHGLPIYPWETAAEEKERRPEAEPLVPVALVAAKAKADREKEKSFEEKVREAAAFVADALTNPDRKEK